MGIPLTSQMGDLSGLGGSIAAPSLPSLGGGGFSLGGLGGVLDIAGGIYSAWAGSESARDSWKHQKKMMQKRYQWQTQDMIKAGLNPMLAAGASPPGGGVPATYHPENPAKGSNSAVILGAQLDNIKADTKLKEASAVAELSGARHSQSSAAAAEQGITESSKRIELMGQEMSKLGEEVANLVEQRTKMGAEVSAILATLPEIAARAKEAESSAARSRAETELLQRTMDALVKIKESEGVQSDKVKELMSSPLGPLITAYEKGGYPGYLQWIATYGGQGIKEGGQSAWSIYSNAVQDAAGKLSSALSDGMTWLTTPHPEYRKKQ